MATRRMISRSISTSKKVNSLPDFAALLFTWLIAHTDDYGRMDGDSLLIKAKVVPLRRKSLRKIEESLQLLVKTQLISRYKIQNSQYLQINAFNSHQTFKSDRPKKAEYPPPPTPPMEPTGNQWVPNGSEDKRREKKLRPIGDILKRKAGDNSRRV